jgi:hypothetical protein
VNAEFLCGLVKQTLVAQESQLVPRRHTESVLRRQQVVMARYQGDSVIIRWEK